MAVARTPEDVARLILDRFKASNARPRDVFLGNNLAALQAVNGLTHDELVAGLQYAGGQGWIENAPNSGAILTDAGFAAMRGSQCPLDLKDRNAPPT